MTRGMPSALHVALPFALLALAACRVPDPCDPGTEYDHGVCVAIMAPMPDSGTGGDGDGDGDGDEDGGTDLEPDAAVEPMNEFLCPVGGDKSVYGRECTSNDDCECPANICITALGYCTGTQCTEPGKECPADMTCLDIAPFREMASFPVPEEVTHVCL